MSDFPLWSDLIRREAPVKLQEMYPSPIEKDNPAPVGVAEAETLNPRSPILSRGTRVRVPHKGRMVSGKVVRYDKGDGPHGSPFYVVDVGEYESAKVPIQKVMKEAVRRLIESDDQEMMLSQLHALATKSAKIHEMLKTADHSDIPAWIQAKVSTAVADITAIMDYMMFEESDPVDLPTAEPEQHDAPESEDKLAEANDPAVPMRLQAAMVIAKSLGSVKGTGQIAPDIKLAGGSPESIVNQAIRVWLQGSHTPEGWALGAKMLKLARHMGINWDAKLVQSKLAPITLKKLGLDEDAPSSAQNTDAQRLRQQQDRENDELQLRHEREKAQQQQRDAEEKIRQQQLKRQQSQQNQRRG